MKYIILFVLPLLILNDAMAQSDYHPFIEDGKMWYVGYYPYGDCGMTPFGMSRYYFEGDTLVADIPCKRWMKDGKLLAPLFEKNRKVYFFRAGGDIPQVLYDFDVSEEDSTEVTDFTSSTGKKVICYIYGERRGSLHHLLLYDSIGLKEAENLMEDVGDSDEFEYMLRENFSYAWTEGIGVMDSPEENVGHGVMMGDTRCLVRVTVGDNIIYDNPRAVWTDGISPINNSQFTIHNEADAIYDLSGRQVVNPKRGLYIQGGRKVVKQ